MESPITLHQAMPRLRQIALNWELKLSSGKHLRLAVKIMNNGTR